MYAKSEGLLDKRRRKSRRARILRLVDDRARKRDVGILPFAHYPVAVRLACNKVATVCECICVSDPYFLEHGLGRRFPVDAIRIIDPWRIRRPAEHVLACVCY